MVVAKDILPRESSKIPVSASQPPMALLVTVVAALLLLVAPTAVAQTTFTPVSVGVPNVFESGVAFGDYNNDGLLDFAVVGSRDTINASVFNPKLSVAAVYQNNGDGTFTAHTGGLMPVAVGSVAWGDVDNDGYLDLVYGGIDTLDNLVTKVYHNNAGNGTFTEMTSASIHGSAYGSVALGDYDNDGWLDILITGFDAAAPVTKLYHNNHDGTFTEVTAANLRGVNGHGKAVFGDYDNDGYPDILVCGRTNPGTWVHPNPMTLLYHNNKGTGTFTLDSAANFVGVARGAVAFADFNNDGYLDVFVTGNTGAVDSVTTAADTSLVYLNDGGNGSFTAVRDSVLHGTAQSIVAIGDFNRDGKLDLAVNGFGSNADLYAGNGNGKFSTFHLGTTELAAGGIAFGDFNGDGYLDVIATGSRVGIALDSTIVYRNSSAGSSAATAVDVKPNVPTGLKAVVSDSAVTLSWALGTDATTPSASLSYALRVGTTRGGANIVSPLADSTGKRRVAALGMQNLDTSWTLKRLAQGTYYWSVQAIDNGYAGSAFAAVDSFTIGTVTPPGATLVTPKTFAFDSVLVFATKRDTVLLKNTGGSALKITATHAGDTAFAFSPDSATVNAGDSTRFAVTFKPTAVKAYSASLFLANNSGSGKVDTVTLTGNGKVMTLAQVRKAPIGTPIAFQATVSRARGRYTYVQDTAAGLVIFQSSGPLRDSVTSGFIRKGDRMLVGGKTTLFNNLLEISGASSLTAFSRVSRGDTATIRPVTVTLTQLKNAGEQYESRLVKVSRLLLPGNADTLVKAGKNYTVTGLSPDTTTAVTLYTASASNAGDSQVDSTAIPKNPAGKVWLFTFTGPIGQYSPSDSTKGYELMAVDSGDVHFDSTTTLTGVEEPLAGSELPKEFRLEQNYPNPFNPATVIEFALPKQSAVSVKVYTMLGQEVATLVDGTLPAGIHRVSFQAGHLASGLYFYRIQAGTFTSVRKMMLVK